MTAAEEARAEAALGKRVEEFKRQWGQDQEPDPGWQGGYRKGYADARDAEVERLTAQLQAARATIAEAYTVAMMRSGKAAARVLSRADLSTLAEHDKQVAAKALTDAARDIEPAPEVDPETVTAIYDPYDVADLLRARAASIEQTEANRG